MINLRTCSYIRLNIIAVDNKGKPFVDGDRRAQFVSLTL